MDAASPEILKDVKARLSGALRILLAQLKLELDVPNANAESNPHQRSGTYRKRRELTFSISFSSAGCRLGFLQDRLELLVGDKST